MGTAVVVDDGNAEADGDGTKRIPAKLLLVSAKHCPAGCRTVFHRGSRLWRRAVRVGPSDGQFWKSAHAHVAVEHVQIGVDG